MVTTSQDWLESFGLSSPVRDGPAPHHDPAKLRLYTLANPSPPDTRSKATRLRSKLVMQREQDEREEAKRYQLALCYRGEQYLDSGNHFSPRAVIPSRRGKPRSKSEAQPAQHNLAVAVPKRKARLIKSRAISRILDKQAKSGINPKSFRVSKLDKLQAKSRIAMLMRL